MQKFSIFNRNRNSLDRVRTWFAEGDITIYNSAKGKIGDGSIDWDTDTIKCTLHSSYTPDIDTHDFWDDVSSTEASGLTNYSQKTMTCSAPTIDTTNDWAEYDATDVTWTALGSGTLSHFIIWKDTGTPSTSPLILYGELGTTNPNGGNYTLSWNADGVFKIA